MAHIRCHKNGKWYDIVTGKNQEGPVYIPGSLLLYGCPFPDIPLELGLAITPDGEILFRYWEFCTGGDGVMRVDRCAGQIEGTPEMMRTVKELMDGQLRYEGIQLKLQDNGEDIPAFEQAVEMTAS